MRYTLTPSWLWPRCTVLKGQLPRPAPSETVDLEEAMALLQAPLPLRPSSSPFSPTAGWPDCSHAESAAAPPAPVPVALSDSQRSVEFPARCRAESRRAQPWSPSSLPRRLSTVTRLPCCGYGVSGKGYGGRARSPSPSEPGQQKVTLHLAATDQRDEQPPVSPHIPHTGFVR